MKIKVEEFERQEGGRNFVTETELLLFNEVSSDSLRFPIVFFK